MTIKNLLVLAFLLGYCLGFGQFGEEQVINLGDGITAIHSTDVDDDGLSDLIVLNSENRIAWYKNISNTENLLFEPPFIISDFLSYSAEDVFCSSKDFDQDGDTDVFAKMLNGIFWFENTENGASFKRHAIHSSIDNAYVFFSDVDADLDEDIIALNRGRIIWLENQNDLGDFDNSRNFIESILHGNDVHQYISVGDFDGDHLPDVLTRRDTGVLLYKNLGDGNFDSPSYIIENEEIIFHGLHSGDLDEDGIEEIVVVTDDYINVYDSSEYFLKNIISVDGFFFGINKRSNFKLIDFDLDGDLDIITIAFERASYSPILFLIENSDGVGMMKPRILFSFSRNSTIVGFEVVDFDNDGDLDIFCNNKSSIIYLENLQDLPSISGVSFFDKNTNGVFDSTEPIISNIPILLSSQTLSSYTDANGTYRFYVPNGTYTLSVQPDSCYQLTTDSLSYTVTIDGDVALNKNFGFQLASDYQHTQTRINSAPTRCGFDVPFTISVQNDGCVPSQGQYGLVLDSLVTLVETAIEPNEIRGDTLLWNYEELFSTQSESIQLTLQIAGTEFLGDFIHLTGLSYIENEIGELALSSTYNYTSEIRCAYDPNDKLVYPNRLGDYDKNYTLFEEELEYTVRFQNTGTDTAFTVIIKDYLDPNLNWKTFKPVVSSHPHETLLHPDGLVEFTFKNILLPDSTTNEPSSHGFVTYKIKPNADLEENTNIENTANIFFDFNPPIETNTTSNILVEELPKATSTQQFTKTDFPIKVYPNPFEEILTFELEQFQPAVLEIFDARGKLVRTSLLQNRIHQESVSHLPSGLYFYRLLEKDKHQLLASGRMVKQ